MSDKKQDFTSGGMAAVRRRSWKSEHIHTHRGHRITTFELEARLAEVAEERRRVGICNFLLGAGVPNTVKAHRKAIRHLWPSVEHRFGTAPDPAELVEWRNLMRTAEARLQMPIVRRWNGGGR